MSGPKELAASLREWNDRLDVAEPGRDRAVVFAVPVPDSAFARMELALLVLARETGPGPAGELRRLDRALRDVHAALASVPDRCTRELGLAFVSLADYLESLLDLLDGDGSDADLGADPGWARHAARFRRAAGPCGVMDLLTAEMESWVQRRGGTDLDPEARRELAERWLSVRRHGDSLFEQGVLDILGFPPGKNR